MRYIVQPRDTLWGIAATQLGDSSKWLRLANLNGLSYPYRIVVGQEMIIDESASVGRLVRVKRTPLQRGMRYADEHTILPGPAGPEGNGSLIPSAAYVFVLADEVDPLTKKVVRRVVVNPKMAEDLTRDLNRPVKVFDNLEKYGFSPTAPESNLPLRRHAQGMKPSPFSSASTKPLGASRFKGRPFWIDVAKAEAAGATVHSTQEILDDIDILISKAKNTAEAHKFIAIKELVRVDDEVLIKGSVPASAIKGPLTMSGTRVLQGVQIVGFAMTAVNMAHATEKSIQQNSTKPVIAETIRQVGGWGAAWGGMKIGAAGGALLGIESGPGSLLTGTVGGVVGGFAGYFGFDWIADHIDEN